MTFTRRLQVQEQPESSFEFSSENLFWAQNTIRKYPEGRQASAIIPLLWRAHEQNDNWLSRAAIEYVARMLGMPFIRALEVATFYTMFQLQPVGVKAHVQICGTTPCMLRGANELIEVCKSRIHAKPFHRSCDGAFSWEEVECLGACVNAPMVQIGKDTYEDLSPDLLNSLLDSFATGQAVKPGPQIDRQYSAPEGGMTALTQDNNITTPKNTGEELTDAQAKRPAEPANRRDEPAKHEDIKEAERKGEQKGEGETK